MEFTCFKFTIYLCGFAQRMSESMEAKCTGHGHWAVWGRSGSGWRVRCRHSQRCPRAGSFAAWGCLIF